MEACRKYLEPYHPAFWRAITGAFDRFKKLPDVDKAIFSETKRARSTVMWSYIMHEAARELGALPGVTPHTLFETTTYEVTDGQIETRLKKVNAQGFSKNYPTARARSFFSIG